jgi:glycosyltransferase involved in cell wall biosynthesis
MHIALNGYFIDRPATGSGQYLLALLAALGQREPDNPYTAIVPSSSRTPRAGKQGLSINPADVRVPRLGENIAKLWFEQVTFPRACRTAGADIAHVPYFAPPLSSPVPTVVTIHDLIPLVLPAYRGSPLVRAYTRLVSAAARRADAVIVDSEFSKRDVVRLLRVQASRVHVVYLAANARPAPAADPAAVRARLRLPAKYLLYLGGYDQRKNVGTIIRAFARSGLAGDGWKLVLAGVALGRDSEFFPSPERLSFEAGLGAATKLLGWVDERDKPALFGGAAAFLFPSRYEGFGLPPLEAMANGVPVLSSNASSLPEVCGSAARLLDPNDVDGWSEAMCAIVDDEALRKQMSARGLEQANKFSWRRAAEETLRVYHQVASSRGARRSTA